MLSGSNRNIPVLVVTATLEWSFKGASTDRYPQTVHACSLSCAVLLEHLGSHWGSMEAHSSDTSREQVEKFRPQLVSRRLLQAQVQHEDSWITEIFFKPLDS
jgi:hypothetical protein